MPNTVKALMLLAALILFFLQWWNDRQWKALLKRLPAVRARIRERIREELCLDCAAGEPHACRLVTEEEWAETTHMRDKK